MSPSTMLQASARRATARRVICSPPPAIITGGRGFCTGFGSRIASSTWKYRPWKVVRGSVHIRTMSWTASSICRMRVAGLRWELPAVLLVLILEEAGSDAERQPAPADQIDARRDLGQMRGIAIADRGAQGGETDTAGDGGQPRQNGPAFQDRLVGRAHAGDLDHVVHDREPGKAVILGPLRLRLHRLEGLGRVGPVEPRRVVNAESHQRVARRPRPRGRSVIASRTLAMGCGTPG